MLVNHSKITVYIGAYTVLLLNFRAIFSLLAFEFDATAGSVKVIYAGREEGDRFSRASIIDRRNFILFLFSFFLSLERGLD